MRFAYYPGCSLERNASAYDASTRAVAARFGVELQEIADWNCCGATEYISVKLLPAYALVARNLALAQEQLAGEAEGLVAPCSACFLNLSRVDRQMGEYPGLAADVNRSLAVGGLRYDPGSLKVRHLLRVVVEDVGLDAVRSMVSRPLYGLRVAPYYGCMIVRPAYDGGFDDPEQPTTLDSLLRTLGATVVDYPMKAQCCGGHMTQISEPVALEMIRRLLGNAADYKADAIATLCPMCQLNLESYQDAVNKMFGTRYDLPVMYFTQLLGLALGIDPEALDLGGGARAAAPVLAAVQSKPVAPPRKPLRSKDALPMPDDSSDG